MKLHIGIISASLAVVLAGGTLSWGFSTLTEENESTIPKATKYATSVPYPQVNTFQGVEAPAGIDIKRFINDNQTEEEAKKTIKKFHEQIDSWVGFGNYKDFHNDDKNGKWSAARTYDEMKPAMYRHLAKVLANVEGAEIDLYRLADLAKIAQDKNDVTSLIYMHRILHDLDYYEFSSASGEYWGVSEAARMIFGDKHGKGNLADINRYIDANK